MLPPGSFPLGRGKDKGAESESCERQVEELLSRGRAGLQPRQALGEASPVAVQLLPWISHPQLTGLR